MSSTTDTPDQEIIQGDCIDEMQAMDADSVHAVVCDPPYGLAFMGRTWDQFEPKEYQEWCEEWASEALRVLKPGGHLIAFSGNRTHHRLFSAVEDAGFEIRDTLTWHYGSGFPKGASVSNWMDDEDAETWDGWRSSLKPSTEFAVLARKPPSESSIYRNVLKWAAGALNIDRTRILIEDKEAYEDNAAGRIDRHSGDRNEPVYGEYDSWNENTAVNEGRYPANLLLDGVASRMLDEQSGACETGTGSGASFSDGESTSHEGWMRDAHKSYEKNPNAGYDDEATGTSRFFYTSKSSKTERTINGQLDNEHPTVKPLDLMEWLVTLATAPGQRVLDPFAGSGTTIMACRRLNREGIGIEKSDEHAELARKRVELAHELETERVPAADAEAESDDGPATLESFADADDD